MARGQEEQAKKGCCVLPGAGHRGATQSSAGMAAPGRAACPPCPALSYQGSQELQAMGHAAGSAHLSRLCSFQVMHPTEPIPEDLCDPDRLRVCLRLQSLLMIWLALRALVMLTQRRETVSGTLPSEALLAAWCWGRRQGHGLALAGRQEVGRVVVGPGGCLGSFPGAFHVGSWGPFAKGATQRGKRRPCSPDLPSPCPALPAT